MNDMTSGPLRITALLHPNPAGAVAAPKLSAIISLEFLWEVGCAGKDRDLF
jgi:hypothetical protein